MHFTRRQGSTINLSSGGAALIGLGAVALTESESPGLWVGVSSACALIMHQILFHSYKKKNLESAYNLRKESKKAIKFSMKVTPENYFTNKYLSEKRILTNPTSTYPIVKLNLVF